MDNLLWKSTFSINAADCDMFGRLRPSAMLKLMQGVGWQHADALGLGNELIWSKGLLWVIGRTVVEISRLPRSDEEITLLTWPGQQRRIFLPRSFALLSKQGESLIQAKSIYLLLSKEKRKAVSPESVDLAMPKAYAHSELSDPPARITFPPSLSGLSQRSAQYSELDLNGHLNNTHYLDWGEDLLDVDFHRQNALRSLWVEYRKEVRPENLVSMEYALQDNILYVKGGEYFSMKMGYGAE